MKKIFALFVFVILAGLHASFFNFSSATNTQPTSSINLENVKRISRSCYLIQHEYYDAQRIQPLKMLKEGFYGLAKEVPEILPIFLDNSLVFKLGAKQIEISLTGIASFYDILLPISKAFEFIHANYKGEVKPEDMEYGFIAGMLSILDPHSNILPPKVYEEFKTQTQGEYGGLGIVIGLKENELTVVAPIEDTPAFRAGVQADDKIQQIGDQSTVNMSLNDAVDLMRGPPGTKITLKIKSKNIDVRDVTLQREVIIIKSVQAKLVKQGNKNIAIVRVKGFQEDTYTDLLKELSRMNAETNGNLNGIVMDMRNNPGGLLDQAILIADHFLTSGDIVYTVGANNQDEEVAVAKKQDSDVLAPMILLINEGSASASEIVAGALKNNNRALILGQKSFGKGSVQSLFSLRDGSSLKLTVAQYLTPGKESIQAVGIWPDIHVYPSLITDDFYDLREDINFGENKLDAHLVNQAIKKTKPFFDLTYAKEEAPSTENDYVSKIREDSDYPLALSLKLVAKMASMDSFDKNTTLQKLKPLLDKEAQDQDQTVTAVLKKRGIDWKMGTSQEAPRFSVRSLFLNEEGEPIQDLTAGTTVRLRTYVKNLTNSPLYRVMADIDSINPLLNHKEFVYGKLEAGQESQVQIDLKIPADVINFVEEAKFFIYTQDTVDKPQKSLIATRMSEKQVPQFAYSYKIYDGNLSDTKGNSNGIPEKGESVAIEVSLKNLGLGTSENTIVNIRNTEGAFVFLKKARETLGELKPQGTATAKLYFDVRDNFEKEDFSIDFFAIDDKTRTSISDKLKFNTKTLMNNDPPPGQLQLTPKIVMNSDWQQNKNQLRISGQALDDTALKDIIVYAKGRKLAYINLEDKPATKHQDFMVDLPLEDGANDILIQVRSIRDIAAQKNMAFVYHDPAMITADR